MGGCIRIVSPSGIAWCLATLSCAGSGACRAATVSQLRGFASSFFIGESSCACGCMPQLSQWDTVWCLATFVPCWFVGLPELPR